MLEKEFPQIHYYDQDFVDIYDKSWAWMPDFWHKAEPLIGIPNPFYVYPKSETLSFYESCLASFFLVYFHKKYPVAPMLDNFYALQEESGAIRGSYDLKTGKPQFTKNNPHGLSPPLLAWAEYNLYHKVGAKKRVRDIMPSLMKYHDWIEKNFQAPNGLYNPPLEAVVMDNSPRKSAAYLVDFNSQMAINALYLSALADILNDKELSFRYKRQYFSLKTRINSLMWDPNKQFYHDLNAKGKRLGVKTLAGVWPLMAEIPNEERLEGLVKHLKDAEVFGTDNPFPSLAADEKEFREEGYGARGSVFPSLTYMVIKGLEKYHLYDFAREAAIRHMYFILDTYHPESGKKGTLWEAYRAKSDGKAIWPKHTNWNRPLNMAYAGLSTIALMIENVVGLYVSLPRKTVDWFVPTLELMGIENLPLKRNHITIVSNKSSRGWEIRLESEKLYYFSVHLLEEEKNKVLPIPSGKCSMLIDKL